MYLSQMETEPVIIKLGYLSNGGSYYDTKTL